MPRKLVTCRFPSRGLNPTIDAGSRVAALISLDSEFDDPGPQPSLAASLPLENVQWTEKLQTGVPYNSYRLRTRPFDKPSGDVFVEDARDQRLVREPLLDRRLLETRQIPRSEADIDPPVFANRRPCGGLVFLFRLGKLPAAPPLAAFMSDQPLVIRLA
jgi:hypothetical protein